jgi:GDP-L-fucose synthase
MPPTNDPFRLDGKRIWVAGHTGMVGAALVRRLASENCQIITVDHATLDLRDQGGVRGWMADNRPDVVIVAAAKVGGIYANDKFPVDFLYDNMMIEANIIEAAHRNGVAKLLFLGSSCIYPKMAPQPMQEDLLMTGPVEATNEWYSVAKISGIKLCQAFRKQYGSDFISAVPTNLYGPGDNYDPHMSHVIPALILKAHKAKLNGDPTMPVWGSGTPRREFMYVDDCADACVHLLKVYSGEGHINVGFGEDVSILELTTLVSAAVGFTGAIKTDPSKPDGAPRKLLDSSRLKALGWSPSVPLRQGLTMAYDWFKRSAAHSS